MAPKLYKMVRKWPQSVPNGRVLKFEQLFLVLQGLDSFDALLRAAMASKTMLLQLFVVSTEGAAVSNVIQRYQDGQRIAKRRVAAHLGE